MAKTTTRSPGGSAKRVAKPAAAVPKPVATTAAKSNAKPAAAKPVATTAAKSKAKPAAAKPVATTAAKSNGAKPVAAAKPLAAVKPAAKPAAKPARARRLSIPPSRPLVATVDESGLGWVDAGKGYFLSLEAGKLVAKNAAGKRLSSIPKEVKEGELADQLEALRDWLLEHDRECIATVEQWMLRSLSVPRAVLEAVWEDPAWRKPLENAVVVAVREDGSHDEGKAGLFRGADRKKGVGVVDLDGETAWLATERVAIPHPILIPELDQWRELITQLGVTQGISQLHRETHVKPPGLTASSIDQFEDGKFAMLMHAVGKARSLGFKVRGGFATTKAWDGGKLSEARYWIGADSPDSETYTGQLLWVDARERGLNLAEVGPVAFSEGMRMASSIYAARVVEKQETAS